MPYLYLVSNGLVAPANVDTACDWESSAIALADNASHARAMAVKYDRGLMVPDNLVIDGQTIVALQGVAK